ncbi:MAG: hypothetical protein ACTHLW_13565 [Verrucomicrobiota bacterium]
MSHIEISNEEQELLTDVLDNDLLQLEVEIERTDSHDFKEGLKHRRDVLKGLLNKVTQPIQTLA